MVTLNLTIFVEVGLFLIFLWAMNRWIFSPVIKQMDHRDAQLEEDRVKSVSENESAESLEKEYATKIAAINRDATLRVTQGLRKAQNEHLAKVGDLRRQEEQELAEVRAEATRQIEAERQHFPELIGGLVQEMAARIGLEVKDA